MDIKFDMIGLLVQDLEKMVTFYRDIMGINIDWSREGPELRDSLRDKLVEINDIR